MKGTVLVMMVLSGLCFLPSCFPRVYIYVRTAMTLDDAQSYCRSKYTDLAAVQNEQELAELNQLIGSESSVWIGLRPDTEAWRWSLENQDYYGVGGDVFRFWSTINGGLRYYKVCVVMKDTGGWVDSPCATWGLPFVCYNGTAGNQNTTPSFILVSESMYWRDAQQYCRNHYTDLASIRNKAENDQIQTVINGQTAWIGLYRNSWKWSDGSPVSVSNWDPGRAPTATETDACVVSNFSKWTNTDCTSQHYFACFTDHAVRKQVVQVVLEKTDSSVDMEELKEGILQKLHQRLKDQGLNEDTKLRWVEQPDGKIFHKKNTDKKKGGEKEEMICPLK